MKSLRSMLFAALALAFLAFIATPASADGLTYYACQNPDGHWNGSSVGFTWSGAGIGAGHDVRCSTDGDGLRLHLSDALQTYNEATQSRFDFHAPPDTGIQSLAMYRETRGIRKCFTASSSCSATQDLLNYQTRIDGVLRDTCSPFAPGPTNTGQCNTGLTGVFSETGLAARHVVIAVTCGYTGSGSCARDLSGAPAVNLRWIRVGIQDTADPAASAVSGSLAATGRHHGTESVSFNVTDRGTGVYRGLVEIDGRPVYDQVIDGNVVGGRARCKDVLPGDTDPHQFIDPVPCKLSASGSVAFDTRTVQDGAHELRVVAEDAAGNRTTVLGPQRFVVDNVPSADDPACRNGVDDDMDGVVDGADPGCSGGEDGDEAPLPTMPVGSPQPGPSSQPTQPTPPTQPVQPSTSAHAPDAGVASVSRGIPNGDRPSDDARLTAAFSPSGGAILTARYGGSVVVRGRLVDGRGAPIGNARVELLSRNANPGSSLVDKGGARTRPDGTWTMVMPRDLSSRMLSFRYRSHLGDVKPVTEVALTLRVRAAVALSVTPRIASSRGALRISGRLLGGPLPTRGKIVELQARGKGGGRWITFRTVRSDARGRFSTRYRFRNTVGPVTYVFRARAREEAAYPFLTGASRVVSVRVR